MFCIGVDLPAASFKQLAAPIGCVGSVGPGHARKVQLFQPTIPLIPSVRSQCGIGQLGAVLPAFIAKDAGQCKPIRHIGCDAFCHQCGLDAFRVGLDVVLLFTLVQSGQHADGFVETLHDIGKLIAV